MASRFRPFACPQFTLHDGDGTGYPFAFRKARQTDASALVNDTGIGTHVIAKIRISDTVLSHAQVQTQFALVDTDGDSFTDRDEITLGTNPGDATNLPNRSLNLRSGSNGRQAGPLAAIR